MKYKSNSIFFIALIFIAIHGPFVLDFLYGYPLEETMKELVEMYSFPNLAWVIGGWVILLTVVGGFCKEVIETEHTFIVKGMLGLINYTYNKKNMIALHLDQNSKSEHIKMKEGKKTSIIYPVGTRKFYQLTDTLTNSITRNWS